MRWLRLAKRLCTERTIVGALFLVLVASNGFLLRQNLQYRAALDQVIPRPNVGEALPRLTAVTPDGRTEPIRFEGNRTLVMYLSPSCTYCSQQTAKWKGLIDSMRASGGPGAPRVVAIGSDSVSRVEMELYLRDAGLTDVPVYLVEDEDLLNGNLRTTPTTVLVSSDSVVEAAWVGVWTDRVDRQVRATVGLTS